LFAFSKNFLFAENRQITGFPKKKKKEKRKKEKRKKKKEKRKKKKNPQNLHRPLP